MSQNRYIPINNNQVVDTSYHPLPADENKYDEAPKKPNNSNKPQEVHLNDILKPGNISFDDKDYVKKIVAAFNIHVKSGESVFTTSSMRGNRLTPSQITLATKNSIPEIASANPNGYRVATQIILNPTQSVEHAGTFDLNTTNYIAKNGVHIILVPRGKYAKAYSNNQPMLLDEGIHVIHDSGFVIHDIRAALIDQNEPYIHHETFHIVRVPNGSIAKVWKGQEAVILESQDDPYVFNSALFKVHPSPDKFLVSANEKIITHGAITRIIPNLNEVAVINDNGILKIGSEAQTLNSATTKVTGFLSTAIKNLILPSQEVQALRRRENKSATDEEVGSYIFSTKDSLRVGVKLFVAYKIVDPQKAISQLNNINEIVEHIENCATVEMGKAIQQRTSQNFLNSGRTTLEDKTATINTGQPSAPPLDDVQNQVYNDLKRDLEVYGIDLIRLNFETPKIMDKKIAEQLSSLSMKTSEAYAKEAVMTQQTLIARNQAEMDAAVSAIGVNQANANLLNTANTNLDAAKKEAERMKTLGDAEGEIYKRNPVLLQLRLGEKYFEALAKANITIYEKDINPIYGMQNGTLFGIPNKVAQDRNLQVMQAPSSEQNNVTNFKI